MKRRHSFPATFEIKSISTNRLKEAISQNMALMPIKTSFQSHIMKKNSEEQELKRSKSHIAEKMRENYSSEMAPSADDKDESIDRNPSIVDSDAETDELQENISPKIQLEIARCSSPRTPVINKLNKNKKRKFSTPGFAPQDHATSAVKKVKKNLAFEQPTAGQSSHLIKEGPSSHKDFLGQLVKDGDFIAGLHNLNEKNTYDLYRLEGRKLNLYMMLKNRKKFIATAKYVAVSDMSVDDHYIGPIPVHCCPNVEDHVVVETEHELVDLCKAWSELECKNTKRSEFEEDISLSDHNVPEKMTGSKTPDNQTVPTCGRTRKSERNSIKSGKKLSTKYNGTVNAEMAKRNLYVTLEDDLKARKEVLVFEVEPAGQASNLVEDYDNGGPSSPEEEQESQEGSDALSIYASDNDFQSTQEQQESEEESSIYGNNDGLQSAQLSKYGSLEQEFKEGSDTLSVHAPSDDEFK